MARKKSRREKLEEAVQLYKSELRDGFDKVISSAVEQLSEEIYDLKYEIESWADNLDYTNLQNAPIVGLLRNCESELDELLDFLNKLHARDLALDALVPNISNVKFPPMMQRRGR
jgi:hypothetical protein